MAAQLEWYVINKLFSNRFFIPNPDKRLSTGYSMDIRFLIVLWPNAVSP